MKNKMNTVREYVQAHRVTRFVFSHRWLAFFYGIFLCLYEMAYLRSSISAVHPVLIFWAAVVIAYDLFIGGAFRRMPYTKLLFLFLGFAALSTAVNVKTGGMTDIKAWILTVISLLAFLPACMEGTDGGQRGKKKTLFFVLSGFLGISFLASFASDTLFFLDFYEKLTTPERTYFLGVHNGGIWGVTLFGVYADSNHAAAFSAVSGLLSFALLSECRKGVFSSAKRRGWIKGFAIANIAVQTIYFPLANSRGGWLSLGAAVALTAFLFCLFRFKKKEGFKRIAVSLLASVLVVSACCGTLLLSRTVSTEIYLNYCYEKPEGSDGRFSFHKEDSDFTGSGRTGIWQEALIVSSHHPVIGIGTNSAEHYAKLYVEEDLAEQHGNFSLTHGKAVHNSYLDVLLSYGLLGFLSLMSFFVLCMIRILRRLKQTPNEGLSTFLIICAAVVLCCSSFFLSCMFIGTTATYFLELVLVGYLVSAE